MIHVLVADALPESSRTAIAELGCSVHFEPGATADDLPALLRETGASVLVVRSTKVTATAIESATRLELVIRAGAGVNTIDLDAASAHAVRVANCPGTNAAAVAELAIGLLIALDRRIPDNVVDLRAGRWDKKGYSRARGLAGRTLGVVGTGSIGRAVIRRAQALGMHVVAWSRSLDDRRAAELGVVRKADVVDLARDSDAVSVHVAAAAETRGLLDAAFFDALPEGALFINTARAEVVDDSAMRAAVRDRGLRVALDVFAGEPAGGSGEVDTALFSDPGIYGTHHIGASTEQAQQAVAEATVERVRAFVEGTPVPSLVNMDDASERVPAGHTVATLEIRHRNRVGVLAHALTELERAGINVRSMHNALFNGDEGALATIQVEPVPDGAVTDAVTRSHEDILAVRVTAS